MDDHQEDHLDHLARMDFGTKKKHFERIFRIKKPLPTQPMTTKCEQINSDQSVSKAYDSKNQTAETIRPLKPPKAPKPPILPKPRTWNHTPRTSRCYSSLKSAKKPEKETTTTKESRFTSLPDSPKGTEGKTATTNESRFGISSSTESTKGTEEETATLYESSGWSPNHLEVFKHPMCLIRTESEVNEDGEEVKFNLKSEEKVFEQIKQIDLPIVVVAVVGLYRTGKSYLMNCLAESFKGGFELGDTIQSQTKGIWVWCKMHPTQMDTVLVLLDTEGLGDVEKGDQNHDNNLFTLATLLCNCLVFNIKGAFDNDAVSKLTFVTEMAKNIRYRGNSSENNNMLNLILPDFVLCLRDFTLKLMVGGKSISPNEYLERSLAERTQKRADYNKPRECIRKYFPKRRCFTFPMPGDLKVIQDLENLSFEELCESFRKATVEFKSSMYDVPPKEMLGSKPINGEIFVTLADRYVTAIKHGAVPDVDDAFTAAAKIENARIEKQALEIFKNQMIKVVLPVPGNVLMGLYTKAQQATLEYLRKNVVLDLKAECEYQAQRKMDELWYKVKKDNDTKVQEMCEKELDLALKGCIEEKLRRKEYETAGGYRKFQRDVERLREEYVSNLRDFEENEILYTWYGFVKGKKETEARIVEADEHLSKKEKEDEQRRNQECIGKLLQEQRNAQQEAFDKHRKDLEDHYKQLDKARDEQLKADQAKHEALSKERLEKEAAQREIKRYEEETKQRKDKWFGARMWKALWNDY